MQDASRINRSAAGGIARCDGAWRPSRRWGAVAVCAWACASAPAQQAAETVVRLYPSAVVSGESVMLSDVAEVRGESAQLAAQMELGAAPHVGKSGHLELSQVQSMLGRRGINLSNWVFRGASRCTIQRVGRTLPRPPEQEAQEDRAAAPGARRSGGRRAAPPAPAISGDQEQPTTRPAEGTEASRAAACDPHSLEAALRDHISRKLANLGGAPVIRFSPGAVRILALARPTYEFRITDRADRQLGMIPLDVAILEEGQLRQSVPVIAEASLKKAVVVAARPINRGEILKPNHLVVEERVFDRLEDIGLTEMSALIGQRAKRFIENHAVLSGRDIEPMPLILANDLVTVLVRRGGLTIRGSAKALSAGGFGDTVRLRNEMSKEEFAAVVTAQKTAEVSDAAGGGRPSNNALLNAMADRSSKLREDGQ